MYELPVSTSTSKMCQAGVVEGSRMWLTRNSHFDLRAVRQFNSNLGLPSRYRDIRYLRYAESPRHRVTASQRQLLDYHLPAVNFSAPHLQLPRTRSWLFPWPYLPNRYLVPPILPQTVGFCSAASLHPTRLGRTGARTSSVL